MAVEQSTREFFDTRDELVGLNGSTKEDLGLAEAFQEISLSPSVGQTKNAQAGRTGITQDQVEEHAAGSNESRVQGKVATEAIDAQAMENARKILRYSPAAPKQKRQLSHKNVAFPTIGQSRSSSEFELDIEKKTSLFQLQEVECLSLDEIKELREHHSAFARRVCEQKKKERTLFAGVSAKRENSSCLKENGFCPEKSHTLDLLKGPPTDALRELAAKMKQMGIEVDPQHDYGPMELHSPFSRGENVYETAVTSPSAALAAAAAGASSNTRDSQVSIGAPTSEAAAASTTAVGVEEAGNNTCLSGEGRQALILSCVENVLMNDGTFVEWLEGLEVYHLVYHLLQKNRDCRDFNNRRIESLLLLKALYHRFKCEKQEFRRQKLMPKEKHRESRPQSPLIRRGKKQDNRKNKKVSTTNSFSEEKEEVEELSLTAFTIQ